MKVLIGIFICGIGNFVFGQDSILRKKELSEVSVIVSADLIVLPPRIINSYTFNREQISAIHPEDVSQVLQKLPGIQIKSYGGLGGFKTFSTRSTGSAHTAVVQDGFSKTNIQTGQINLGTVQTDNLEFLSLTNGSSGNFLNPASAEVTGSVLSLGTFECTKPIYNFDLRANIKQGSFNQYDAFLSAKKKLNNHFIAAMGKYRQADGLYPVRLENGSSTNTIKRSNNDYQDVYAGLTYGYNDYKNAILFLAKTQQSDQGLPGPVILYGNIPKQRLSNQNQELNLSYTRNFNRGEAKFYSKYAYDNTIYVDSGFLNNQGFLRNEFNNQFLQNGITAFKRLRRRVTINSGLELQNSELKSKSIAGEKVSRNHGFGFTGLEYRIKLITFYGKVSSQYVVDQSTQKREFFTVNPFLAFGTNKLFTEKLTAYFYYKNTFRMPTFNELYYNQIGNKNLEPEKLNQFSATFNYRKSIVNKSAFTVNSNTYYNQVKDQILAIPTKNLFIWSIQNIGRTETIGSDLTFTLDSRQDKKFKIQNSINITYQHTVDVSSKDSPTYRNQIAYIPLWNGNYQLTLNYKNTGFYASVFYNSKRYYLNQNVPSNEIEGFVVLDVSIFHSFILKKEQKLKLQMSVKNVTNNSYAYVRSYFMPGTNYLISLSYALH